MHEMTKCTDVQEEGALLYKLSIDVMETECHVTSRKPWKQCEVRSIGDVPVSSTWEGISPSLDTDSILLQSKNQQILAYCLTDVTFKLL